MSFEEAIFRISEIGLTPHQFGVVVQIFIDLYKPHRDAEIARREKDRQHTALYRSRGGGRISSELRAQVFERDGFACVYCGSAERLECDHLLPVSKGGSTSLENLAAACKPCNCSKGDKVLPPGFQPTERT